MLICRKEEEKGLGNFLEKGWQKCEDVCAGNLTFFQLISKEVKGL